MFSRWRNIGLGVLGASIACLLDVSGSTAAVLNSEGVGPLRLGMSLSAALRTGWLADRGRGCPLASPVPTTYRLAGPHAPRTIRGDAEFLKGRLTNMSFTRGIRTTNGITLARSTTGQMISRFKGEGFDVLSEFDSTFDGTFVAVRRGSHMLIGGFAPKRKLTILGIPNVPVCE